MGHSYEMSTNTQSVIRQFFAHVIVCGHFDMEFAVVIGLIFSISCFENGTRREVFLDFENLKKTEKKCKAKMSHFRETLPSHSFLC